MYKYVPVTDLAESPNESFKKESTILEYVNPEKTLSALRI